MRDVIGGAGVFFITHRDARGVRKALWCDNLFGRIARRFKLNMCGVLGFGRWGFELVIHNLVTNAGLAGVASQLNGAGSPAYFDYLAVGTGSTAAAAGNTTLETEITDSGLARAQDASTTRETTTETNDTAVMNYEWTVSGTKAVVEAGVLNASSNGVLLARQVFSAINVVSGDTLEVIYKFAVTTT